MKQFIVLLFLCFCAQGYAARGDAGMTPERLETGFRTIPDSIQTAVYWYWISDHITEEGIVRDLEAMKSVGINRAFIGNIGLGDQEAGVGEVYFRSEAWWHAVHTALKTATRLGIEIGIFNSPGWSQSGGPWIAPEQSMRYLASTAAEVTGGKTVRLALLRPERAFRDHFQDVRTVAYPSRRAREARLRNADCTVEVNPAVRHSEYILDGDLTTHSDFILPGDGGDITVCFHTDEPFELRGLELFMTVTPIDCRGRIEVKSGDGFRTLEEFPIARFHDFFNVGFDPYPPVVISVPETVSQDFRLVISGAQPGTGLREVVLSSGPFVERYPEKSLAKMYQNPLPYWPEYMWREQPQSGDASRAVNPAEVVDISGCLQGDTLTWDAPAGDWTVLRTGMLPTGAKNAPARPDATGLEVDKMSKRHVRAHFDAYLGEMLRRIPAEDRKSWKMVVQDSYETGGQNFTDDFLEAFERRYGYDPLSFLPAYYGEVVGSESVSDRFLWDMRRFVADRVAHDYVAGLREVSNEHGLRTWLECYGHWGFPGEFLQYGGQSDEIGGEFWSSGTLGDIENRAASSCGHIYGKRRISAESFTSGDGGYHRSPADYKQRGDRFFAEGINNTLLHLYILQAYEDRDPGLNAWFGNEFNRKNTWFPQMDLFVQYLKRANYMLQQGLNVADVAYFIGEDAPKMTGITEPALPKGYQFDYINAEVIEHSLSVCDGLLTLPHGTRYRMLVLPPQETMRPGVLGKIERLIKAGAVVLGPAPKRSPSYENYPFADAEVRRIAGRMWSKIDPVKGYARIGAGMLIDGLDMEQALALIDCPPDCEIPAADSLVFNHRTVNGMEIYFVANQGVCPLETAPVFRTKGLQPELWNAIDGSVRPLPDYTETGWGTRVPLEFGKYESAFIVFRSPAGSPAGNGTSSNYPRTITVAEPEEVWELSFDPARRGPSKPVYMDRLADLTTSGDFDVRHYSGKVLYRNVFTLTAVPAGSVFVDLGALTAMAKVKINGRYVGGVWTPPYRIDITDAVRPGRNELEVEVVTTWKNRLIGDLKLPDSERFTQISFQPWTAESDLQPSGLLGPVGIVAAQD